MIVKDFIVNIIKVIGKVFTIKLSTTILKTVIKSATKSSNSNSLTFKDYSNPLASGCPCLSGFSASGTSNHGPFTSYSPTTPSFNIYYNSAWNHYALMISGTPVYYNYGDGNPTYTTSRVKADYDSSKKTLHIYLNSKWYVVPNKFAYQSYCTLTYNANGGSGSYVSSASMWSNNGESITVQTNSLTKTGYTASGWNTSSDGSGSDVANSSTLSLSYSRTIYAKWIANSYKFYQSYINTNLSESVVKSITLNSVTYYYRPSAFSDATTTQSYGASISSSPSSTTTLSSYIYTKKGYSLSSSSVTPTSITTATSYSGTMPASDYYITWLYTRAASAYNIPAGTYVGSSAYSLFNSYISNNSYRTLANSVTVTHVNVSKTFAKGTRIWLTYAYSGSCINLTFTTSTSTIPQADIGYNSSTKQAWTSSNNTAPTIQLKCYIGTSSPYWSSSSFTVTGINFS